MNEKELNPGVITKAEPLAEQQAECVFRLEDVELKLPFNVEPFYFTVALYNRKSKEKISEDFHFIPESTHKFFNVTSCQIFDYFFVTYSSFEYSSKVQWFDENQFSVWLLAMN